MIKKLQHRLTMLYALTTGIILTIVVIAVSIISQLSLLNKIEETFQTHIMNISTKLQTDTYFNVSWLAAMEYENNLIIHIEENAKALLYHGAWNPPSDRISLIQQAKEQAKLFHTDTTIPPVSAASISPVFTIRGQQKDEYQCIVISYPAVKGYKSMVLLYYISPFLKTLEKQRYLFIISDILGVLALYCVSRILVKKAVKPIEVNNLKQQEFVAAASHELRSPLMVIQSSAQAIEAVPEKTTQFTQTIRKECQRMSSLISDMLTLASLDAQNWPIKLDTLDINTLLIDTYELYEPICLEKQMKFDLHLPDDLMPSIQGDKERILQILSILLDNAVSYNSDGKPIQLVASLHKNYVSIAVIDQGPGILEEQKEKIFDRFFRSDTSRKDKQHFGLGLSICKELVILHKGTLNITDTPGGGCTFTVRLPINMG